MRRIMQLVSGVCTRHAPQQMELLLICTIWDLTGLRLLSNAAPLKRFVTRWVRVFRDRSQPNIQAGTSTTRASGSSGRSALQTFAPGLLPAKPDIGYRRHRSSRASAPKPIFRVATIQTRTPWEHSIRCSLRETTLACWPQRVQDPLTLSICIRTSKPCSHITSPFPLTGFFNGGKALKMASTPCLDSLLQLKTIVALATLGTGLALKSDGRRIAIRG